jgi:hypothetical protein
MAETDLFKHSTPSLYDRYMGPLLFERTRDMLPNASVLSDQPGCWKPLRVRAS